MKPTRSCFFGFLVIRVFICFLDGINAEEILTESAGKSLESPRNVPFLVETDASV